jgi:sigma-B regulation protein RsbU (phosphoserine phosphatase)
MQRVNRSLRRRGIEGLFCTLAYALFDFQDRSLRVANSGLPHPFHFRAAEGRAAPLDVSGLPLGTFDGVSYDEVAVELAKGDVVVFYTDGLVEARQGREE